MLTSGTRGDILPYLALALGLQQVGLDPVVVTHPPFARLVQEAGISFASLGDNPTDLMTRPGEMPLTFSGRPWQSLRATLTYLRAARPLYREMLGAAYATCRGADLLIIGLSTFWGESLAESLGIPLIWAPLQPLTPTSDFSSALLPFRVKLGRVGNRMSHQLVMYLIRLAWLDEINTWRRKHLQLSPLRFYNPSPTGISSQAAFLYGISPHVMSRPADWPENHHLTGFWFMPDSPGYQPPTALRNFLEEGDSPLYIGFGSMAQTPRLAEALIEAAGASEQRIVAAGLPTAWDVRLPPNLFPIGDIPHPWLFQHIRAAIHHGGAGTTAASLRAGLPTAITPVGVDQFFWGERVAALGVGPRLIPQRALDAGRLVGLIHELIENPVYRSKAREIGARLRSESGVTLAAGHIQAILF